MGPVEMVNAAASLVVARGIELGLCDYSGFCDWLHPFGVAERVRKYGEIAFVIALLHDVIEDYKIEAEELSDMGFPVRVVSAVSELTRRADEAYSDYIKRVVSSSDILVKLIKIADIQYNLSRVDYGVDPQKAARLRARWLAALDILKEAVSA